MTRTEMRMGCVAHLDCVPLDETEIRIGWLNCPTVPGIVSFNLGGPGTTSVTVFLEVEQVEKILAVVGSFIGDLDTPAKCEALAKEGGAPALKRRGPTE